MSKKPFLLDSNVFIEAHQTCYASDFCSAFWQFLAEKFEKGSLVSIQKVYNKIVPQGDELSVWIKENLEKSSCFVDQGKNKYVVNHHDEVEKWVKDSEEFFDYAKRDFLKVDAADPWLCSYAMAHDLVVVTSETRATDGIRKRVPLVNVLDNFNVTCVDVFCCLRSLKARFELA